MGNFNCRNVRGSSTKGLHGEGRALGWGLPLSDEGRGREGHELVDLLGSNADKIGVHAIIYDGRSGRRGPLTVDPMRDATRN